MKTKDLVWIVAFATKGTRTIKWTERIRIAMRIWRTMRDNPGRSASSFGEQLTLVNSVLEIPPATNGAIAEFGCYKGLSSVALSIAAKKIGRRLIIFDSFAGLPESTGEISHIADNSRVVYKKGDYAGSLPEVRTTIERYGEIDVVEFVQGYFCDTLPKRPKAESYAMIFEDADLVDSVKDVLRFAWPKLPSGGLFYSHEALDLEVVKLFFDDQLWAEMHGVTAPGLAGGGVGLPIDQGNWGSVSLAGQRGSYLAYSRKR